MYDVPEAYDIHVKNNQIPLDSALVSYTSSYQIVAKEEQKHLKKTGEGGEEGIV